MRKIIFIFLVVFMVGGVLASSFSPSKLTLNSEIGEKVCGKIILDSDSETITVNDLWAENENTDWKVSLFNKDAKYHKLSVDYDSELFSDEREVEFCVSGKKAGEYHGVILLREAQEGNSIIQMGVWLDVAITEKQNRKFSNITGAFIGAIKNNYYIIGGIFIVIIVALIIFYKIKNGEKSN